MRAPCAARAHRLHARAYARAHAPARSTPRRYMHAHYPATARVRRTAERATGGKVVCAMAADPAPTLEALDEAVDHVRGAVSARVILVYGDYECPYTRLAFREIERVEEELQGNVRFAYRHYPLTEIHAHALAAAAAAEAASLQGRFWQMHELLFHRQKALEDADLHRYANQLELDAARFELDKTGAPVLERIRRDVQSGDATGAVQGTPTIFIDGLLHRGRYDADALRSALRG